MSEKDDVNRRSRICVGEKVLICAHELTGPDGKGIPLGTDGLVVGDKEFGSREVKIDGYKEPIKISVRNLSRAYAGGGALW